MALGRCELDGLTQTDVADGILRKAESFYKAGSFGEAAATLGPLVERAMPDPTALRMLGLCRLGLGNPIGALSPLQQAYRLVPADPNAQLHFGVALRSIGRHAEAAPLFRSALAALLADPAPCINLAGCLLALGDAKGAVQIASEACHRAPGLSAAHYTYGLAWLAFGEPARAEEAFKAAVALTPAFADAWVNLGLARYRLGFVEGAKLCMVNALRISPSHRAAIANLGAFMRLTGEPEAAELLLHEALERDPDAVEIRISISTELLQDDRPADALLLLEPPAPVDPHLRAQWGLQRASALVLVGRTEEARSIVTSIEDPTPDIAPLMLWRRLLLAVADGDTVGAITFAEAMEAALDAAGEAVQPEHQIGAAFNLAKFWSGLAQPTRAVAFWARGHRRLSHYQPFSRRVHEAFVNANITAFSHERLQTGARANNADPAPVFIVGMPRSGTTLVEQILATHHDVHGAGERASLGQLFTALGGARETADAVNRVAQLDTAELDTMAAQYLGRLHTLAPSKSRIVDKMPGNFNQLGLVGTMLPGARIIHCIRDPRDVGLSIFSYRFLGYHGYSHDLADLGWYIGQHNRLMAHWAIAMPNPVLTLRLDDWVEDFAATLARVLSFLGLVHDPACELFYENDRTVRTVSRYQVRQPINSSGIGRWRGYAEALAPMIEQLDKFGALNAWTTK
jgi:Flp pilus assembly protein TadD